MKLNAIAGLSLTLVFLGFSSVTNADGDPKAADIFAKRIMPIFKSPNPSSCTECHLAGVDLKNYILPSHRDTFLSLRDQGLNHYSVPVTSVSPVTRAPPTRSRTVLTPRPEPLMSACATLVACPDQ